MGNCPPQLPRDNQVHRKRGLRAPLLAAIEMSTIA